MHSKTPFKRDGFFINDVKDGYVARTARTTEIDEAQQAENAQFIVDAVNAYESKLLEYLIAFCAGGISVIAILALA